VIVPELEKAVVFLPFAEFLLPARRELPNLAVDIAADAALAVDPFLELVGRHAAEFPKAGGVGDKWPNRRRGPGERDFPTKAVESVAARRHGTLRSSEDREGGATLSGFTAFVIARRLGATRQSGDRKAPGAHLDSLAMTDADRLEFILP
jgi:hypothetical protein